MTYRGSWKSGAKARISGSAACNYSRDDFMQAWIRGHNAAESVLNAGESISDVPPAVVPRTTRRWVRHRYGSYGPECPCDNCVAKRRAAMRKATKDEGETT